MTGGTADEQNFTVGELVKALEEVDTAQRDPLPGATCGAGEDDFLEEPAEWVHAQGPMARAGLNGLSGWPAERKSRSMRW